MLPTIPAVFKKLLEIIEDQRIPLDVISRFISNDPVLSTKVLRMVNSPIYGFPGRISSISKAVVLLGLNAVKGLLLGVSVFELMKSTMIGLWEHSLGCAVAARLIAVKKGLKEPEEISVGGLLHDIGKVILMLEFNETYNAVIRNTQKKDMLIFEAENKHFHITHADAGTWVTEKWCFPRNLIEMIEYHHEPDLTNKFPMETATVHLADILVRAKGYGFAGDSLVPAVNPCAWEMLSLSESDLRDIFTELEDSIESANGILD
jgi:putative nucleotidyltransferase with HDIG domain